MGAGAQVSKYCWESKIRADPPGIKVSRINGCNYAVNETSNTETFP